MATVESFIITFLSVCLIIFLFFTVPVQIELEHNVTAQMAGHKVNLTCLVKAHPLPAVEWFKDDEMVNVNDSRSYVAATADPDGVTVSASLKIDNLQREDNGTYVCQASNEFTNATASQDLLVQGNFPLFDSIILMSLVQEVTLSHFSFHYTYIMF